MSAKKVQNKPHVNEVCTDSVFMKRLMREIKRLQDELAHARSSETQQLLKAVLERQAQILGAKPDKIQLGRRRTWCPLSVSDGAAAAGSANFPQRESRIPPPG